ncbi:MAG: hypothetical protein GYB65_02055 [Chloroflexi bacterium]|nr:hypothetical protein [Chloroflexota bacterium]
MKQVIGSLLVGILAGLAIGVFLGWEMFPVQYTNSSLSDLDTSYQEQYTIMVAEGYLVDGDIDLAIQRLQALEMDNAFEYVQDLTERYISQSQDENTICKINTLCKAMGRCQNTSDYGNWRSDCKTP